MATAGTLVYNTKLDTSGMNKGLKGMTGKVQGTGSTIKSILGGLGIAALVSKGISAISSSMDGAIKRLDTMNNFPKVMSNLGISTERSQKSINKLSDKLQGLPTSIDAGAQSVQRLTSKNGDIEKSTDLFLAMNNAILAGGAPMQIQETAIEQLSQAYAKGKPDMMEWRTMMTAMPAQLKQVAIAMGYVDADQLGEDLRKGNVSMDDFMNTLVKLNKEGTGNFQSFEQQARNSTGGIQTAITNMKTAITRGVAGALDSLDKSLQDANLGGLSGVISSIGRAAEQIIKKLATIIPPIIQKLAELYNWMKKHETLVKILAGAILGLMVVVKVVAVFSTLAGTFSKIAGAIKIAVSVFKVLWTIIKLVGTAFKVLGAIMIANPIGIIIAIVAALIAIFVLLWKKSEGFRNFWIGLWNGIKNIVSKAWEGIKSAFNAVISFVKKNWKTILLFLVNPFAGAFRYLYKHSDKFKKFVDNFVKKIVNFFKSIPSKLAELPGKIVTILKQIPAYIGYLIGWIIGKYVAFYMRIWQFISKDIPRIVTSIINWFKQLPGRIWAIFTDVVNKTVSWGKNMINKGIETGRNFLNNVINYIKSLPGRIWTWLSSTINKVAQFAVNMKNKGVTAGRNLLNAIVNGIKSLPSRMASIGKNIVNGIWNGIKNAKNWLLGKIKEFTGGVVKGFKKALGIKSPSRVLRDEVGKWIPEGIAVGIDANTDSVMKALDDMDKEMVSRLQNAINNETGKLTANANIKGNSFLNNTTVNSHVVADVYMDRTKVGQAITPVVSQTLQKAGVR